VLEESLDIMRWALRPTLGADEHALIAENDSGFKRDLDRYKYPHRYGLRAEDAVAHRTAGGAWLLRLEQRLSASVYLFGAERGFVDLAIMPFVRQFARHDQAWFDAQPWPALQQWLAALTGSELFLSVMKKVG
jgi:glutathione S-transferase